MRVRVPALRVIESFDGQESRREFPIRFTRGPALAAFRTVRLELYLRTTLHRVREYILQYVLP